MQVLTRVSSFIPFSTFFSHLVPVCTNLYNPQKYFKKRSLSCLMPVSPTVRTMALKFEVLGRCNRASASKLTLPHFECQTPLFMPVGTQGTIKGLTTSQLEDIGCQIILGNTYHLELRPGSELIDELGGLHNFMNWPRALLTLRWLSNVLPKFPLNAMLHLADITEKGVTFQSPVDGKPMLLTPEESIQIQNRIGADIIMALDDVVKTTLTVPRVEEAMHRTIRWIDRCIAGGEEKDSFWRVVAQCNAALPEDKPQYVMGVGYPLDIAVCSALGADMYDCVYPTRTARFGTALVPESASDMRSIDPECTCMFPKSDVPEWVCDAMEVDISTLLCLIKLN
ncbi:hypothetical protein MKX01_009697 [Papaver californicum]|nr:hypothetical protein MKX01_009697 [Papaver californicum]